MRVRARCFATLRELSAASSELDLPPSAVMADAWDALTARYPALAPHRPFAQPARNGESVAWDVALADGDEVAFLPPVSGGGSEVPLIGLTADSIDVAALERMVDTRHGAVVTFVGRARRQADDGRAVLELEYEAYPEMADAVFRTVADEVEAQWPECAMAVVHRTGRVPLGEAAVAIVTAAPHRSDAYDANRYVIEAIKARLPIWKRERFADGSQWKRPGA